MTPIGDVSIKVGSINSRRKSKNEADNDITAS